MHTAEIMAYFVRSQAAQKFGVAGKVLQTVVFIAVTNAIEVSNADDISIEVAIGPQFAQIEGDPEVAGITPGTETVQQHARIGRTGPGIATRRDKLRNDAESQIMVEITAEIHFHVVNNANIVVFDPSHGAVLGQHRIVRGNGQIDLVAGHTFCLAVRRMRFTALQMLQFFFSFQHGTRRVGVAVDVFGGIRQEQVPVRRGHVVPEGLDVKAFAAFFHKTIDKILVQGEAHPAAAGQVMAAKSFGPGGPGHHQSIGREYLQGVIGGNNGVGR